MKSAKKTKTKKKKKIRRGKKREATEEPKKKKKKNTIEAIVYLDPWHKLPSAWGGRASPAEEYEHLLIHVGTWIEIKDSLNHELVVMFRNQELEDIQKVADVIAAAEKTANKSTNKKTNKSSNRSTNKSTTRTKTNTTTNHTTTSDKAVTAITETNTQEQIDGIALPGLGIPPESLLTSSSILTQQALDLCIDITLNPPISIEINGDNNITTSTNIDENGAGVHVTTIISSNIEESKKTEYTTDDDDDANSDNSDSGNNSDNNNNNTEPSIDAQSSQQAWGELGDPWTPRSSQGKESKSTTSPLERIAAQESAVKRNGTDTDTNNATFMNETKTATSITSSSPSSVSLPPIQSGKGLRLSVKDMHLSQLNLSSKLRNRLVALNLSHNQFTNESIRSFTNVPMPQLTLSADLVVSCMPLYLREITITNNDLITGIPHFGEACHTLLKLDLSECHLLNITDKDSEEHLRILIGLRSLTLKGCGISKLCRCEPGRNETESVPRCSLSSRTSTLEHLDISNNQIIDINEMKSLICLKRLVKLNIAGNGNNDGNENGDEEANEYKIDHSEYNENIRKICLKLSTLKEFNGHDYKHGMKAAQFTDMIAIKESGVGSGGGGDDGSSCSCVEGNPCLVSYNCKNWARRYDISKANGWKGF